VILLFPSFAAAPAGSSECNTLKTSKKNLLQSFGISQIQLPLPSQKIRDNSEDGWGVLYHIEFQNTLPGLIWPERVGIHPKRGKHQIIHKIETPL
jgi:hypothetical protein